MNDTSGRPRNWLRIVLGVSLALNLLVVGLIVGAIVRFGDMDGHRSLPHSMGAAMFRELPREDRQALRQIAGDHPIRSQQLRAEEARLIADALQTNPFDRDAVQSVLDAQTQHRVSWQNSAQMAWLDQVSQMSTAVRSRYAERLYDSMTHRPAAFHQGRGWLN